jgi:tetratricopeptide (TPR) repeat protein
MKCYSVVLIVIILVLLSIFSVNPSVCIAGNITDEDYFLKEGLNYLSSDQYLQALDSFKKIIEINPNSEKAHAFSGTIYHILGLPAKAIDSYKEAIKINPSFLEVHYQLGLLYRDMGKYDDAIESFNKTIQIDPNLSFCIF